LLGFSLMTVWDLSSYKFSTLEVWFERSGVTFSRRFVSAESETHTSSTPLD
jgi:hypothetical protein